FASRPRLILGSDQTQQNGLPQEPIHINLAASATLKDRPPHTKFAITTRPTATACTAKSLALASKGGMRMSSVADAAAPASPAIAAVNPGTSENARRNMTTSKTDRGIDRPTITSRQSFSSFIVAVEVPGISQARRQPMPLAVIHSNTAGNGSSA